MTGGGSGYGSDGSYYNADTLDYPGVPYGPNDFNGRAECATDDLNIHVGNIYLLFMI
jgi:alpha-amylase